MKILSIVQVVVAACLLWLPCSHAQTPPGSGGGNTNSGPLTNICAGPTNFTVTYQLSTTDTASHSSNDLWLELAFATNNVAALIIHTTNTAAHYDVFGTTNLSPDVPPLNQNNWMWLQRARGGPTNFLWTNIAPCEAWFQLGTMQDDDEDGLTSAYEKLVLKTNPNEADTDGDGLSDRFELTTSFTDPISWDTGNLGLPDGYKDPDNDGWTNIDEERNETNPSVFNTPAAPVNVVVHLFPGNTNVLITWGAANGPVTGYVIRKNGNIIATMASNVLELTAPVTPSYSYGQGYQLSTFTVQAIYTGGESALSVPLDPGKRELALDARLLRGRAGAPYLAVAGLNASVSSVLLAWVTPPNYTNSNFLSVSPSDFVNGVFPFPTGFASLAAVTVQAIDASGEAGPWTYAGGGTFEPLGDSHQILLDNLRFFVRGATRTQLFSYIAFEPNNFGIELTHSPSTHEYSGFRLFWEYTSVFTSDYIVDYLDGERFREENSFCRNFAYDQPLFRSDGFFWTGAHPWNWYFGEGRIIETNGLFHYDGSSTSNQLSPNQTGWIFYTSVLGVTNEVNDTWLAEAGLTAYRNDDGIFWTLASGATNYFGLPIDSVKLVKRYLGTTNANFYQLAANQSAEVNSSSVQIFVNPRQPTFEVVNYCFSPIYTDAEEYTRFVPPIPSQPDFSPTNTTPVMIASVGQPFTLSGWAKKRITNGDTNKFAYLEQFFDKAYVVDRYGVTNETGLLSEYGEFFPVEPGPTVLKTKPDIETGEIGEALVHVIGLFTDADHDGTLEPGFARDDSVSSARPFRFWVNDDDDSGETGGKDIPGESRANRDGRNNVIDGVRDLVDFFPVHIDIGHLLRSIPTNQLNSKYRFHLRQADSALNFTFTDLTPDEPLAYLTEANVAASLATQIVTPISAIGFDLNTGFLLKIRDQGKGIILVEARTNTTSPLVLEVWRDSNLVAQTELALSVTGVESMFRHKNLIGAARVNSFGPPDRGSAPNEPETIDKNFVFLHGYNVNPDAARGFFAETFKRLYWSGSQAKFHGVSWHGFESQDIAYGKLTPNYHVNVKNAFLTAPALSNYLAGLSGEIVVAAHSLGNMVALSALNDHHAPMDKYFMIDAAVAIEAIDGAAPPAYSMTHSDWALYNDRLYASYWWRLFPANDHRSQLTWSNRLAEFHNADVFNFYSSGEEVLRDNTGDPPLDLFGIVQFFQNFQLGQPASTYAWVWQEKGKGRSFNDNILGSSHGGWKFNTNAPYSYLVNNELTRMPPSQATALPASQLQTNAFFDTSYDFALFGPLGSAWAQGNRDRILSDAIPAMSWAIGSHAVSRLTPQIGGNRNFDMNVLYQNGWPSSRPATGQEALKWHHSDFREVAYVYTHELFTAWVNFGNLKED